MQFGFLGINYKNAQLNIRDKTAFTDDKKLAFFRKAERVGVEQCMALSTCNRSEVYYIFETDGQKARLRGIYEELFPDVIVRDYLTELSGEDAMAYLFRVAAGLESLALGEDQILGQVKEAVAYARAMGYVGKELNKIVRDAVTCAKKVKTEFKISERPLSVSYIGIRKLEEVCGISGKRILVIGSGKTAALALQYIYEYPKVSVVACSRTYAHAKRLIETFPSLAVIPYETWRQIIGDCDIIVSATSSPHLIIKQVDFHPKKRTAMLDLAAPRDIDTGFSRDPLVDLINLDTLQLIAEQNQKERERLVAESRGRMEDALQETICWLHQSRMDETIESLQQRCSTIVEDAFSFLNRKMELGEREKKLLKKVLNASLQRLLREPIHELKRLDSTEKQEEYKRLIQRLFQI
ncbi:MAG: glutamyl-tRNA reductase [Eubacterium sp.]|jgi:glutamyl-tRNA reductase|nr:glutamyl-tRNA reductase [Eubacterium sp.]